MPRPQATPQTAPDSPLDGLTGYLMKRAFSAVQDDLTRVLEPFGLRMLSFSALAVVADHPGISQSHLARALSVERSNMVLLLDGLEQAGLITRNAVPGNRRAHALRATAEGAELAVRALSAVRAHEARLFAPLSPAELASLHRSLSVIAGR